MRAIAVVVLALLLSSAAFANSKKDWDDCASNDDDPAVACTRIITQGKESRANLWMAYGNRGEAYIRKGDYDHALADLGLRLDRDVAIRS